MRILFRPWQQKRRILGSGIRIRADGRGRRARKRVLFFREEFVHPVEGSMVEDEVREIEPNVVAQHMTDDMNDHPRHIILIIMLLEKCH